MCNCCDNKKFIQLFDNGVTKWWLVHCLIGQAPLGTSRNAVFVMCWVMCWCVVVLLCCVAVVFVAVVVVCCCGDADALRCSAGCL